MFRQHQPSFLLATLVATVAYSIPLSYRVTTSYVVHAPLAEVSSRAEKIQNALRSSAKNNAVSCVMKTATQMECAASFTRRSVARTFQKTTEKDFPSQWGWIPASELSKRIDEALSELEKSQAAIANAQQELAQARNTIGNSEADREKLNAKKRQIETDLTNRRRQLEILNDAIAAKKGAAELSLFVKKQSEVQATVEKLSATLIGIQETLNTEKVLTEKTKTLQESMLAEQLEVDQLSRYLSETPRKDRWPDPKNFQLQALPSSPLASHRSLFALLYGAVVGWLLGKIRRKESRDTFESSDEVEKWTGLRPLPPMFLESLK